MLTMRDYVALKIREFRKAKSLSADQLGALVGKSGKTIQAWERGQGQPDADKLIELCRVLDVDISDFFDSGFMVRGNRATPVECSLPLVGNIAAGTPIEAIQIDDGERCWASPDIVAAHPRGFFLSVRGDSMNLRYPDGCRVLIDPACREIENGKVYAVLVNGFDATLKQVFLVGSTIVLHPLSSNSEHRDITFTANSDDAPYFQIIGRVVWYVGVEE